MGSPFGFIPFENKFANISLIDEGSDFEFGNQLGFAKAHLKSHPNEKVSVALGYGNFVKFGVSL